MLTKLLGVNTVIVVIIIYSIDKRQKTNDNYMKSIFVIFCIIVEIVEVLLMR